MTSQPGEFWVADLLFTDRTGSKRRPVLVLWLDAADAVVAAVTTTLPRSLSDVRLADWQAAGLRNPSTVRLSRLTCLEQPLLLFRLGTISAADGAQVQTAWTTHVKPRF